VLKKTKDKDNLIFNYPLNLVREGDKAQIQYEVEDFNPGNEESYYKNSLYPEYSWLISKTGEGTVAENPKVKISGQTTDINTKIKKVSLVVGDLVGTTDVNNPEILIRADAAVDMTANVSLYAKDLAGNETISYSGTRLDNVKPSAPTVLAYAWESRKVNSSGNYTADMKDIIQTRDDADPSGALDNTVHFTRGGSNKNDFFVKMTNAASDISFIQARLNGTSGNDVAIVDAGATGIGNSFYQLSKLINLSTLERNGINRVAVAVRDGAGNLSDYSAEANIVVDTRIGDGKVPKTILGGTAINTGGNNYQFTINVASIPELSGLQKVTVKRLLGPNIAIQRVGTITLNSSLNSSFTTLSAAGNLTLDVPVAMQGTRVQLETEIFDNLGNKEVFNYEFLVPKRGVEIKSQASGSEKETRTKVKVVGENQFDLEKTEEAGKEKRQ